MLISGFSSLSFLKSEYPENRHTGYVIPSFPRNQIQFNFRDGHFFSANDAQGHFIYACPPRQNPSIIFFTFDNPYIISNLGAYHFVIFIQNEYSF